MKIRRLHIHNYKRFHNKDIEIQKDDLHENFENLYGNTNVTALIGANGSGKTTILSYIVIIFRYIQRGHDKLPEKFQLEYDINDNIVILEKFDDSVFITINGTKKLLLEMKRKDREDYYWSKYYQKNLNVEVVDFPSIREYIPTRVIASGFDLEYQIDYHNRFICDKFVKLNNSHYFETSMGLYLSKGICRFYQKYFSHDSKLKRSFNRLNISVKPYVKSRLVLPSYYQKPYNSNFHIRRIKVNEYIYLSKYDIKYAPLFNKLKKYCEKYKLDYLKFLSELEANNIFLDYIDRNFDGEFNDKFYLGAYMQQGQKEIELLYLLISNGGFYINDIFLIKEIEYSMKTMSTGEKMIFGRIFFALTHIKENSIVIFEEPEMHLNYLWAKQLVAILIVLFKDFQAHLIVSSHNYSFINNLQSEQVLLLRDNEASKPRRPIFLASQEEIISLINGDKSSESIIEDYIYELIEEGNEELLSFYFEKTGDSFIKLLIFKKLRELGVINVESD